MAEKEKHFIIELFERIEENFIKHTGKHKLTVQGITIESPVRKDLTKVLTIKGNMEFDVSTKKKK